MNGGEYLYNDDFRSVWLDIKRNPCTEQEAKDLIKKIRRQNTKCDKCQNADCGKCNVFTSSIDEARVAQYLLNKATTPKRRNDR